MKSIIIQIEKSKDHYGAYATNYSGIYGAGDTVEKAKENVLEAIELIKASNNVPEALQGEYKIDYKFDMNSFLKYYADVLTLRGLAKITGVNESQLSHYSTGHRNPSKKTIEKIEEQLHKFATELNQVSFID